MAALIVNETEITLKMLLVKIIFEWKVTINHELENEDKTFF